MVRTSGSDHERPVAAVLVATSALVVLIGLTLDVKPALVVTAIVIVTGTAVQATLAQRSVTSLRA